MNTVSKNLNFRGLRLLAVDDHEDCRDFFAILFEIYRIEAKVLRSASQAFEVFQQFRPQILLIDLAMPNLDGFGLLRRIRSFEADHCQSPIPALAITALPTQLVVEQTRQAGYQALFHKPIDIDALFTTISHLMQSASAYP
jgi:CheY-like chemotaxis protein